MSEHAFPGITSLIERSSYVCTFNGSCITEPTLLVARYVSMVCLRHTSHRETIHTLLTNPLALTILLETLLSKPSRRTDREGETGIGNRRVLPLSLIKTVFTESQSLLEKERLRGGGNGETRLRFTSTKIRIYRVSNILLFYSLKTRYYFPSLVL